MSIFLFIYLSISLNGQSSNSQDVEKGESIQRNARYNLEEIKVRWKKAALENCTGVPCVTAPNFTCGTSTMTDYNTNTYSTVLIGAQCWTTTNLKVTHYDDGSLIPDLTSSASNPWATSGARTEYVAAGVTGYVGTYGYLYNWYAVNDLRKLCPNGWHVPTDAEWTTLTDYLGGVFVAGGKMKSTSSLWATPNTGADNSSGFSALPGGSRDFVGSFVDIRSIAFFWSATENSFNSAWNRILFYYNGLVNRLDNNKSLGASVRCLRD